MTVNVAICDDDIAVLNSEAELLQKIFEEKHITYTLKKFLSPKHLLDEPVIYDMVFLDIEMDEINGIELAKELTKQNKDCCIFFITNYSVYLDNAFDLNAIRYLSKPVDINRLKSGIDTAIERIHKKKKKITVVNFKNNLSAELPLHTIIYIENTGRHTRIVSTQYDFIAVEVFTAVKKLIEQEVNYFAMPHQSYYVNLMYVEDYTRESVMLEHSGKHYETLMSRRCYNGFDAKIFNMAKVLR